MKQFAGALERGLIFMAGDGVQTHMTNSRLTDPEVLEWNFPVLLESFSLRRGSGGQGHYKGGDGIIRRLRFLEPMTASILSERRVYPPLGMNGGEPGKAGKKLCEGELKELLKNCQEALKWIFFVEMFLSLKHQEEGALENERQNTKPYRLERFNFWY